MATPNVGMVSRTVRGITVGVKVVIRTEEPMRAAGSLAGRAEPRSFLARIFAHSAAQLLQQHGSARAAPLPWRLEHASAQNAVKRQRKLRSCGITRSLA